MTNRLAISMKWATFVAFVASFVLLLIALPLDGLIQTLRIWIEGLGFWAPLIFSVTYGIAATLFVPASALSLAAGVMFGVWLGSAAVWLGATLAIVLSFLIARYAARSRVEALAETNPRFAAIDRAIGEQGWKIVALMRLSPVFPFTLQNYLFGVTAIRFWPSCIASAVAIVPGTFLYVYLGYAGGQAAAAVGGAPRTDALRLGLQLAGLLATVVVTVVVARIAAKAIAKHAPDETLEPSQEVARSDGTQSVAKSALILAIATACMVAGWVAFVQRDLIRDLLFPPRVELIERYAGEPGTATFDHTAFDALLLSHVDSDGLVDYSGLASDGRALAEYVNALRAAPFENLGRDEKLALLINAYNAFTLQLIVEHYPLDSIQSIPSSDRWEAERWEIAGGRFSLDQIENVLIRANFREDRIHFALVCAALGCPKLRPQAYTGADIDEQLQRQVEEIHASERWFRYDEATGLVWLTQVYSWYSGDFVQLHGSILAAAGLYSPELKQALDAGTAVGVRWLPYDWALNDKPRPAIQPFSSVQTAGA